MNTFDALFGDGTYRALFGFGTDCRAMTADEILQMQFNQQAAMQNAWPHSYIQGLAQFRRYPEKPLDERFADFKLRLAAAIEKRHAKFS